MRRGKGNENERETEREESKIVKRSSSLGGTGCILKVNRKNTIL